MKITSTPCSVAATFYHFKAFPPAYRLKVKRGGYLKAINTAHGAVCKSVTEIRSSSCAISSFCELICIHTLSRKVTINLVNYSAMSVSSLSIALSGFLSCGCLAGERAFHLDVKPYSCTVENSRQQMLHSVLGNHQYSHYFQIQEEAAASRSGAELGASRLNCCRYAQRSILITWFCLPFTVHSWR